MIVLIVWSMLLSVSYSTNSCSSPSPLGMESGTILDYQVSASSSFAPSVGPAMGRLHNAEGGGAWCPAIMVTNNTKEWLEVELGKKMIITGISLQGRWDNGVGQEFSPYIVLMYYDDLTHQYRRYSEKHYDEDDDDDDDYDDKYVMTGNTDTYSVVKVSLDTPVLTSRVRVIPYSYYQRTVCIRLELHGCREQESEEEVKEGLVVEKVNNMNLIPIFIGIFLTVSIILMVTIIYMFIMMNRRKREILGYPLYQEPYKTSSYYHHDTASDDTEPIYQEPIITKSEDRFTSKHNLIQEYTILGVPKQEVTYSIPGDSSSSSTLSSPSTISSSIPFSSLRTFTTSRAENNDNFITFSPIYSLYSEK